MTREERDAYIKTEVAKLGARVDDFASRCAVAGAPSTPEQPSPPEQRDFDFEQLVTLQALHAGVRDAATPYVVSDAAKVFERRENALVARNGETDPGDPLTPLTVATWLAELRKDKEFLFEKA